MKLAFFAAVVGVIATAIGVRNVVKPDDAGEDFSKNYLLLAQRAPDRLMETIASTVPGCVPEASRGLLADLVVLDLAAKTFFKSGMLMSEGKSPEQSATEMTSWVIKQASPLAATQKNDYLKLLKSGLNAPETMRCVFSAVRSLAINGIDTKALGWELRG